MRKNMKATDRDILIKNLEKKGIIVRGYSEEFRQSYKDGIWISAEETENEFFFDYYAMRSTFELGVRNTLNVFLELRGWYAEWYDAGTVMIWKI